MPLPKKNTTRKSKKTKQSKTSIHFTRIPMESAVLPEKFDRMNELHKKTTFLP
jgi:hypothetical protein